MTPARKPSARPRRHASIGLPALLATLQVLGIVPLLAFAALLLNLLWDSRQQETRHDLQQTVRTLSIAIDRELVASIRRLEVLSRLPHGWQADDLDALHEQLRRELAANDDWLDIVLSDTNGAMLVNASLPADASLPEGDRPHVRAALATGRPAVSDIYSSRRTGEPAIGVSVPVIRDHAVRAVLSARLNPMALSRLLFEQQLRHRGVATVFDRHQHVVARSRDIERFFGAQPPTPLLGRMRAEFSGTIHAMPTLDGIESEVAWQRLPFGWAVSVAVPTRIYGQALARSMWWLGVIGAALLAVQVMSTAAVAQRLMREARSVGDDARLLAAGQAPAPRRSFVRQFDMLRRSLYRTGQRLARLLESERRARAQAEAASRGKDELMAMLGHELRNPLAAIGNGSRLLAREDLPADARERTVGMLRRQTDHMRRLVDDLLDVGRMLAGKIALTREPLDLAVVTGQALEVLRAAGRLERHRVRAQLDAVPVSGDAVRLEQIVVNLVTNAVKYTPDGGSIEVRCGRVDGEALVRVHDDGAGMSAELLAHAFEPFVQGPQDLQRAAGGLGLGLTLSRRLAELHGGRLEAESAGPGRGSTFTVRLPAA